MSTNIIKELSKKYSLPEEVIEAVCRAPFAFIADRIRNSDSKDMRLYYIGKIKMKNRYKNEGNTDTVISKKAMAD